MPHPALDPGAALPPSKAPFALVTPAVFGPPPQSSEPGCLSEDYRGKIRRDVDPIDFCANTWGCSFETIEVSNGGTVTIPGWLIKHLYSPNHTLRVNTVLGIVAVIEKQLVREAGRMPSVKFHRQHADGDKPSIVLSPFANAAWPDVCSFIQVGRSQVEIQDGVVYKDLRVNIDDLKQSQQSRDDSLWSAYKSSNVVPDRSVRSGPYPLQPTLSLKTAVAPSPRGLWPSLLPILRADEKIAASHLSWMLCRNVRLFATGIQVDGLEVIFYHADHNGVETTESFNLVEKPELLVLAIAAILNASSTALGYIPFLHFPPRTSPIDHPTARIEFSSALDHAGCRTGPWRFSVDSRRQFFSACQAPGRRTVCMPITEDVQPSGETNPHGHRPGKIVMKAGFWRESERKFEDQRLRLVRKRLADRKPKALEFIAELVCSVHATINELDMPRSYFGRAKDTKPLMWRAIIMPAYLPMVKVRGPLELKKVWIDVAFGHHWLWIVAKVLHGDLSPGNIMFERLPCGRVVGKLTDFDLAHDRKDIEASLAQEAALRARIAAGEHVEMVKYGRSGTGAYISAEQYSDKPRAAAYRQDLEGLYNVLTVFLACHRPEYGTLNYDALPWFTGEDIDIGREKALYLSDSMYRDNEEDNDLITKTVFEHSDPVYADLIQNYALPLRKHFSWSARHFFANTGDPNRPLELTDGPENEDGLFARMMVTIGKGSLCDCSWCRTVAPDDKFSDDQAEDSDSEEITEDSDAESEPSEDVGSDTEEDGPSDTSSSGEVSSSCGSETGMGDTDDEDEGSNESEEDDELYSDEDEDEGDEDDEDEDEDELYSDDDEHGESNSKEDSDDECGLDESVDDEYSSEGEIESL
ncbi:hypothetical protein EIP91_009756 [Steccherinum ochraceum]|uniref:Fungal-type protein kinase domain-containing protein n=1 Tax=Steccherinum ochraceum TaxID=92696 RepID=A0A4R0R6P2_9APHY|nr:hypothetical protein EIP91_009756 [Steccherinum ochraceum]